MKINTKLLILVFIGLVLAVTLSACATAGKTGSSAKITVTPEKTVLSPALIKKPIMITGSGWKPGEMVVVNMILPEGVIVKGVNPGDPVGIANGKADEQGTLKTNVGAMTVLMSFFQVGWDDMKMKPDFKKAKPLPPNTYTVEAIGFESQAKATAALTLLPPPKKE